MKKIIFVVLVSCLAGFLVTSCDPGRTREADAAWSNLTSSNGYSEQLASGDPFSHFMRQVELANIRRRDLGIKFWREFPDDPRRYKWLLQTVLMPPHYAQNLDDWAARESDFGPNAARIDKMARDAWDKAYPAMRSAFWNSDAVSESERRVFWFGEIEQELMRLKEAKARGEAIDIRPVLDQMIDFSRRFEKRSEDWDRTSATPDNLGRLLMGGNAEALGLTPDRAKELTTKIPNSGLKSILQLIALKQNSAAGMTESDRNWALATEMPPSVLLNSKEGKVIWSYNDAITTRRNLAFGAKLWSKHPDREKQLRWFSVVNLRSYPKAAFTRQFENAIRGKPAKRDDVALKEWEEKYRELRQELWSARDVSDEQRRDLYNGELQRRIYDAEVSWKETKSNSEGKALLQEISQSYADTGYVSGNIIDILLRRYEALGIPDRDMARFLKPFLSIPEKDSAPRILSEGFYNLIALKKTPFDFKAQRLDGRPFDLESMRGKIVLIDHWATSCSACIALMPELDEVYRKYKNKGLEVVSIVYDGREHRSKIRRLEDKLGLTWTTVTADGQWDTISRRYGYVGFPQYMLLNRDGTLYAGSGAVDYGQNLGALLDQMLKDEADYCSKHKQSNNGLTRLMCRFSSIAGL